MSIKNYKKKQSKIKHFLLVLMLASSAALADDCEVTENGYCISNDEIQTYQGIPEPSVSLSNQAKIYYDNTDQKLYLSTNTGPWAEFGAGGGGSTVSVDGVEVTDPNFVSTGDTNFIVNGSDISTDVKSIDINANGVTKIDFSASEGELTVDEGQTSYNSEGRTLDVGLGNGVTANLPEEDMYSVKNSSGSSWINGTPIMFEGSVGASGNIVGQEAIADDTIPAEYTVGLLTESCDNDDTCKVTSRGKIRGIQTNGANYGESWSSDDLIYISPTTKGYLTNTEPNAPDRAILVAVVLNAHPTNGTLLVRPTWTPKLIELGDVNGTPLTADGQIPVWENSNNYFDFGYNINNYYQKSGSTGDTLRFSSQDTLTNTNFLYNNGSIVAVNAQAITQDTFEFGVQGQAITGDLTKEVTDAGSGTAWDVSDALILAAYLNDDAASTTITDSSPTANNGTLSVNTSTVSVTGKVNDAFQLATANTGFFNDNAAYDATSFSVEFWVKPTTLATGRYMYSKWLNSGNQREWIVTTGTSDSSKLGFYTSPNGSSANLVQTDNSVLTNGVWTHVIITYANGGTLKIYINGTSEAFTGTVSTSIFKGSAKVGLNTHEGGAFGYDATYDVHRYYDRVLTQTEVTGLYNSSDGTENTSQSAGFQDLTTTNGNTLSDYRSTFLSENSTYNTVQNEVWDGYIEAKGVYAVEEFKGFGDIDWNSGGWSYDGVNDYFGIGTASPIASLHVATGDTILMGNVGVKVTDPDAPLEVNGQVKLTGGSPGADKVLRSDADGLGSWKTPTVDIDVPLTYYEERPSRASEVEFNGGLLSLATGQPLDSVPTNIVVSKGIGKVFLSVNAGSDISGSITITGTSVDRETGATTASDTDTITIDALTTDNSDTDTNGNTRHSFTGAYISSKWFTGSVTLSTTDLTLTDVDVYHVSFEQMNDKPNLTIRTFDANIYTTNVSAEFDAYLYCLDVTGSKATLTRCGSLNVGADGEAAIANRYWRLREGNIDTALDGTTDGIWADIFYSNSPSYVEDVTLKIWVTEQVSLDLN